MPIVSGIEILGNHEEADGIELVQTVGAIVKGVSVRWCRHGIHLVNRNRNVIVSNCHLYENSGVGVYLDDVNLHRFLGLIQEFRRDAQLIVVSHQKRTMEAGDCLLGVSMQPGGSSKVVTERVTAS